MAGHNFLLRYITHFTPCSCKGACFVILYKYTTKLNEQAWQQRLVASSLVVSASRSLLRFCIWYVAGLMSMLIQFDASLFGCSRRDDTISVVVVQRRRSFLSWDRCFSLFFFSLSCHCDCGLFFLPHVIPQIHPSYPNSSSATNITAKNGTIDAEGLVSATNHYLYCGGW